jgi:hypothetical protein
MMSDFRNMMVGKERADIDDAHTDRMYNLAFERYKAFNAFLSVLLGLSVILGFAALFAVTALVVWLWRVVL